MTERFSHTRREVLRLGGITFALHALGAARADVPRGSFDFLVVNDTHYTDEGCRKWLGRVVAAMRKSAPQAAFCLHAGDLTDRGTLGESTAVAEVFGRLGCPIYPVPGNHDYLTSDDRSGYDARFPGRINYRVDHAGWHFLALDSTEGTSSRNTTISAATLAWLDAELPKLEPSRPVFAFTHFPLGENRAFRPRNADALVARLVTTPLRWVHSGHWHGESLTSHEGASLTTSRCCARLRENRDGSPLKGWHVYRAGADGTLARRFVSAPAVR